MKGIISYGAYIPYNRLQRKKIGEFFGKRSLAVKRPLLDMTKTVFQWELKQH